MIVTEKEAATKWCPHARTIGFHPMGTLVVRNRTTAVSDPTVDQQTREAPPACRCIGSRCMAWRWDYSTHKPNVVRVTTRKVGEPAFEDVGAATSGYCGLAGKP